MSARALIRRLIHDNARNLYEESMREAIRDVENKKLASLAHDTKTSCRRLYLSYNRFG